MTQRELAQSVNNTRPAKLPPLSVPRGLDNELRNLLEAMKERLEIREGARGNPFERALTLRDAELLKAAAPAAPATTTADTTSGITEARVKQLVGNALSVEVNSLRSSIDSLSRFPPTPADGAGSSGGGITDKESLAFGAAARYTRGQLSADLASGGAAIFSGALAGTTVMELDPAGNYVLFKHRDANINGLGAGYTGVIRTATGITAAGFVAGYNQRSNGAWQSSIVIDSATGNVTILGTLRAGSVIETGATVGLAGPTIGTVATNASSALTLAGTKLDAGSSYVLAGTVTVQNTGGLQAGNVTWSPTTGVVTGGSGVVMTENGLTGVKAGNVTFAITAAGDATFYGDLDINGLARFSGNNMVGGAPIQVGGTTYVVEYTSYSQAASNASGSNLRVGHVGSASATTSFRNVGVVGKGSGAGKGIGVVGDGSLTGGYFTAIGAGGGVEGYNISGSGPGGYFFSQFGVAAHVDGALKWGTFTVAAPNGTSTSQFLSRAGDWATIDAATLSGPTTGAATATFVNTNKPGSATSNTWLSLVRGGTTYYIPAWT